MLSSKFCYECSCTGAELQIFQRWNQRREIADACAELSVEHDIIIDLKIVSKYEIENEAIGCHPFIIDALKNGLHAR